MYKSHKHPNPNYDVVTQIIKKLKKKNNYNAIIVYIYIMVVLKKKYWRTPLSHRIIIIDST